MAPPVFVASSLRVLGIAALSFAIGAAGGSPARAGDEDEDDLRQRLTEREDKRRLLRPWSAEVFGRPLSVGGELDSQIGYLRRRVVGESVEEPDRLLLEQGLEVEAFYSFGPSLSLFAQLRVGMEKDLLEDTFDEVSDYFVERGEMWLYSENVFGTHVNVDVGRLDFEDERRWWWDEDLDAVRVAYETETAEISLAVARELFPSRSDRSSLDPDHDGVLRVIAEASWEGIPNHGITLFALHHADRSPTERPGQRVRLEREDDSDARLTWVGARVMGAFDFGTRGIAGYWLDAALVRGDERVVEFEELTRRHSVAEARSHRDVSGWAVDAGLSWILPLRWEPRLFAGYAFGSGDSDGGSGSDRAFRQTGLHANEAGFGGVERFAHYGVLLDPELSNLGVATVGAGLSVLRSSSLDLVYHHYRLAEPAPTLRDARLQAELTGRHRELGHEIDLVLALEEWERIEFELVGSAFRAGRAFGREEGSWSWGGFLAVRLAF